MGTGGAAPAELMLTLQTDPSGRERVRSLFSTVSVFLQKYRGVMDLLVHDAPPVVTALDSAALEVRQLAIEAGQRALSICRVLHL